MTWRSIQISNKLSTPLIISCLGAYQGSGVGTGGFVAISPTGEVTEIDCLDSTGLCYFNGNYYRFIRALQRLAIYDSNGLKGLIRLPHALDVHDIAFRNGEFIVVSTGTNEIQWYDLQFNLLRKWNPGGTDDAWHLNCIDFDGDQLYFTAFGDFKTHREWNGKSKDAGFIASYPECERIITGLSGPHTPRKIKERWLVCDSHARVVRIQKENAEEEIVDLGGFTRGAQVVNNSVYIGISVDRKNPKDVNAKVVEVSLSSYEKLSEYLLPFHEIYDVLAIDVDFYNSLIENKESFTINSSEKDIVENLRAQIEATEHALAVAKSKLKIGGLVKKIFKRK